MLIRATVHHAASLAAIHADAFPAPERWGADAMALQLGQPGGFGLLNVISPEATAPSEIDDASSTTPAQAGGLVLARTAAGEAEILTLAVARICRRRGLGGALLGAAIREAGLRGAVEMFLEVEAGNEPALALYMGAGFLQVGRRRAYYPGADALVLRAPILCGSAPP